MSISCQAFLSSPAWPAQPNPFRATSSASIIACVLAVSCQPFLFTGQLGASVMRFLSQTNPFEFSLVTSWASVMRISCQTVCLLASRASAAEPLLFYGPALRASAARPFLLTGQLGQHHEHQLPHPFLKGPARPASCVSAPSPFIRAHSGQHHLQQYT